MNNDIFSCWGAGMQACGGKR